MSRAAPIVFFLALLSGCAPRPAPLTAPAWQVQAGFVRDAAGRAAIFRGVNLSGRHKQPPYFDFHQSADYQRVREEWGFNSVRFLVSWAALEPREGEYDEAYLDGLALRLGWAKDAGLAVVLDMHQDVWGEGFGGNGAPRWTCDESRYAAFKPVSPWFLAYVDPNVIACFDGLWKSRSLQARYAAAWRHLAERLDSDAVVGFDPMNEPFWGSFPIDSFEAQRLQPFYETIVAEVRAARPGWLAFLEPASSRNLGFATSLKAFPFPNVVYAPHSYDSDAEAGKGFDPSRREALTSNLAKLGQEAAGLGAALWVGEYGGNADQAGIGEYMGATYDETGALCAGAMFWHYGKDDGYGLLRADGTEKTALLDALVRPYPERVAGDPEAYGWDESTRTFTFRYRASANQDSPTVISVPVRSYPAGFEVDCGGCAFERAEGSLRLTSAPPGSPSTLVLRPAVGP